MKCAELTEWEGQARAAAELADITLQVATGHPDRPWIFMCEAICILNYFPKPCESDIARAVLLAIQRRDNVLRAREKK